MNKRERIILFFLYLTVLAIGYLFVKSHLEISSSLMFSVLSLMVTGIISLFFVEHYFSKPNDIFTNSLAIILSILPLYIDSVYKNLYLLFVLVYAFIIFILSLCLIIIYTFNTFGLIKENIYINFIYKVVSKFGKAKVLYSIVIIIVSILFMPLSKGYVIYLILFLISYISINTRKPLFVKYKKKKLYKNVLGVLHKIVNLNTYDYKIIDFKTTIEPNDMICFTLDYKVTKQAYFGLITNIYESKENKFIRVIKIEPFSTNDKLNDNCLFLNDINHNLSNKYDLNKIIGFVTQETSIDNLRLIFNENISSDIERGVIGYLNIKNKKILYQITSAKLVEEIVEKEDKRDYALVTATQIGEITMNLTFERYNWLPQTYLPLLLYENVFQNKVELLEDEIEIGKLKNTNIPIMLDLDKAVTHHTAIFGITGSGKSVFARSIVRDLVKKKTKVIVIDFTNEYIKKLKNISPIDIVDLALFNEITNKIESLVKEEAEFKSNRNNAKIKKLNEEIMLHFENIIISFINNNETNLAILTLPDVSNSEALLSFTKFFMQSIIKFSKNSEGKHKICVAIEEAHTVVPEWNFVGIDDKVSRPLVNTMSQVALQGRKYNLGFIVIAQRSANVSKTILTQCNTVISFNQFDNTSRDFLSNYFGDEYSNMLPTLKQREAICTGVAFRSNTPLLFTVPNIDEDSQDN